MTLEEKIAHLQETVMTEALSLINISEPTRH